MKQKILHSFVLRVCLLVVLIVSTANGAWADDTSVSWVKSELSDLTENDIFVIVGKKNTYYHAMSNDKGTSNPPEAIQVKVSNNRLTTAEIADNIQWNITGNSTDGYIFYPNGDTKKWLYCINDNNGVRVGTNTNKKFTLDSSGFLKNKATSRYVGIYNSQDWRCYTSTTTTIANQTFAFYKKLSVKLNAYGFATFCSTCAIDFTEANDYTAWVVESIDGNTINFTQVTGSVPAGVGLLLMGTANKYVYPVATNSGTTPTTNLLEGISTATDIEDGDYFGLSGNEFVKVNAGTVPAGKALLPATAVSSLVKSFTFVFNGADGIQRVEQVNAQDAEAIFNLAGQHMSKMRRGINIINGKKVLVK